MAKPVVVGIDLGASESYVAYVGKGIVDMVQNEVSKRATPTIVGFTDRERLLGDAALAQIRSNAKNSCRNFKHLLGRKLEAPDVHDEHFWSTSELATAADGHAGYKVMYKGESRVLSAVEITAMFLSQLRYITEKWCEGKVTDCVIAVPSSFSDVQRQAVLDAAQVANISVLRILNEHTATALAYGIYRSNDFDPEKPLTVAFCSMGNSLFSVSIVQFVRGRLKVICEKSDKVGGRALDECLMREFGSQFKKKVGCCPLSNKKAAFKLEDAVMKTKKILSANSEAPITVECLMEDADFASTITREDLERMCAPAMERAKAVLEQALAASGFTAEQVDSVELVGGGSRVPWVKKLCSEVFGKEQLSTTMNQEESVARGCALQAAMLSPLYKVRDFKVEDTSPFAINISWLGHASAEAPKDTQREDGDVVMAEVEGEYKSSTVFPAGSPMGLLKSLTFFRKGPFDIKVDYAEQKQLLPMTPQELGTWHIEVPAQSEPKKIKVRARLTLHGTFAIEGAQMVEEEEYEEVVKERREIIVEASEEPQVADSEEAAKAEFEAAKAQDVPMNEADKPAEDHAKENGSAEKPAENGKDESGKDENPQEKEPSPNGEKAASEEAAGNGHAEEPEKKKPRKAEPEKRYEWIDVRKTKKRQKKTDLKVTATGRPGLCAKMVQKLMDQESAMQAEMNNVIETDEKRNDLEAYILNMRNKCSESGEFQDYVSPADREAFLAELTKTEDWLYDTPDATKTMYIDKVDDLRKVGDAVAWRCKEAGMREDWIKAVTGTVANYRTAAVTPGDKFGHIAGEKLVSIAAACDSLEQWLKDMKDKQAVQPKHEKPVLLCAEMEQRSQELARMADDILKEPRPAPPKADKKEEAPQEEGGNQGEDEDAKSSGKASDKAGSERQSRSASRSASPPAQEEQPKKGDDMDVD